MKSEIARSKERLHISHNENLKPVLKCKAHCTWTSSNGSVNSWCLTASKLFLKELNCQVQFLNNYLKMLSVIWKNSEIMWNVFRVI